MEEETLKDLQQIAVNAAREAYADGQRRIIKIFRDWVVESDKKGHNSLNNMAVIETCNILEDAI